MENLKFKFENFVRKKKKKEKENMDGALTKSIYIYIKYINSCGEEDLIEKV